MLNIETTDTFVGAHPEIAKIVVQDAKYRVVGKAIFIAVPCTFTGSFVKPVKAATIGADPQIPVWLLWIWTNGKI